MASLNDIRSTYLDFFERNGHRRVDSSPLVPRNDPTLMFANSGMVQFKNLFTGLEHRDYSRATTAQKCVRAGGKHNDLDNVGYTARHHTFFEMLGNFSFGDYFKDQAIPYAWELLTKDFGLAKDRLLVTVYHTDDEAANIWKKVAGLSDDRIIRIPTDDNFWRMGPTGPCGPCTEIFYDHGDKIWGGPPGSADEDGDRFIEIWNLVFMQFEQFEDGSMKPLPNPSIDTGMGLERIGALLQGKHDNYDTDLMRALIEASAHATSSDPDGPGKVHHRVIADHLRSTSFLIADGVMPSNEGRGYVLRRIMRRAMRHAHILGAKEPLMHRLVPDDPSVTGLLALIVLTDARRDARALDRLEFLRSRPRRERRILQRLRCVSAGRRETFQASDGRQRSQGREVAADKRKRLAKLPDFGAAADLANRAQALAHAPERAGGHGCRAADFGRRRARASGTGRERSRAGGRRRRRRADARRRLLNLRGHRVERHARLRGGGFHRANA